MLKKKKKVKILIYFYIKFLLTDLKLRIGFAAVLLIIIMTETLIVH